MKSAKRLSAVLVLSLMLCLLASCSRPPGPSTRRLLLRDLFSEPDPVETPHVEVPHVEAPVQVATGSVTHAVFIWLKKPGDVDMRKSLIDASKGLKAISGVIDVHAGAMLPSTRPVVDSSYDIGLVFTFTDTKAMQDYLVNPMHLKLLNEVIKPNADHYIVYDFTNQ